jgi:hypothetical protein
VAPAAAHRVLQCSHAQRERQAPDRIEFRAALHQLHDPEFFPSRGDDREDPGYRH